MPKQGLVTIDHLEVSKRDIEMVKRLFKIKDNAEAIRKALSVAAGKIELEAIFKKHKGTEIEKVYT